MTIRSGPVGIIGARRPPSRRMADQRRSDVAVPMIDKRNEMGEVARSVDVFRTNLLRIGEMAAQQERQQASAQREKRELLAELAQRFEGRVQSIIDHVGLVAGEMLETAQSMSGITKTTQERASSAASESHQAADAAQSIATSVEQMSAAAREIPALCSFRHRLPLPFSCDAGHSAVR